MYTFMAGLHFFLFPLPLVRYTLQQIDTYKKSAVGKRISFSIIHLATQI